MTEADFSSISCVELNSWQQAAGDDLRLATVGWDGTIYDLDCNGLLCIALICSLMTSSNTEICLKSFLPKAPLLQSNNISLYLIHKKLECLKN